MTDHQPIILGPSAEARMALRCDFATSSADWSLRAAQAALRGDVALAATCTRIAAIAGAVSRGGEL